MPNSFSQTPSLSCPRCGTTFQAELWLIVDTTERPDLVEKIKDGTLHEIVCPQCGPIGQVDVPLLLYRPGETPPLLFSPAQETTNEQDQEHARALLARLRESLGPAWRDDWLARGLPGVPRPLLPLALTEGLAAVGRKMQEQLPPELREVLQELAQSGVEIRLPEDLERALARRPDLQEKLARATGSRQGRPDISQELAPLLQEISRLHRLSEMPRKIELCQRALAILSREQNLPLWAALQGELANALNQNPQGNRAENLEQAIFHYQQALEVRTRQAYPEQWAGIQNNLANAYLQRIRGERAENL